MHETNVSMSIYITHARARAHTYILYIINADFQPWLNTAKQGVVDWKTNTNKQIVNYKEWSHVKGNLFISLFSIYQQVSRV